MNIVHINTWDKGGAAAAALRLHRAMNKQNVDSNFLVLRKSNHAEDVESYEDFLTKKFGKIWFKVLFFLNRVYNQFPKFKPSVFFNKPYSLYRIHKHPLVKNADVICLHWTVKFLDYNSFFKANENKVFIWTMHDMNPFSGGLHYMTSFDKSFRALEERYQKIKRENLKNLNLAVVGPSKWLMNLSKASIVFKGFPHKNIPYCIDKRLWAVNPDSPRKNNILFVADNVDDRRKGFEFLLEAITYLNEDIGLEILGNVKERIPSIANRDLVYHGFVSDPIRLAEIYASVTVYVIPSLEDNLPNTVIESHICGTAVVGFNRTGVSNMINQGKNGILVNEVSGRDLALGIEKAFQNAKNGVFRPKQIAQEAKAYYDEKAVVESYLQLIEDLT
jgi:glycosyltransferase involved in cell wall biosynthesis